MILLNLERFKRLDPKTLQRVKAGTAAILMTFCLTSCSAPEESAHEDYDIVNTSLINGEGLKSLGLTQKLEVPGEDFKLVTEYTCDSAAKRAWRVTSDKFLYLNVYTEGLPENTIIYLDNVHIDTSIKSKYAAMDGIIQDSMDDRIHNTMMYGFPIGDDIHYYGINAIEGCNQQFIEGSFSGYNGFSSGSIDQKRYTESNYVNDFKVWGNKFQIVYDLLIQGPNDKTPRNVSVATDFVVTITVDTKDIDEDIPDQVIEENQKVFEK